MTKRAGQPPYDSTAGTQASSGWPNPRVTVRMRPLTTFTTALLTKKRVTVTVDADVMEDAMTAMAHMERLADRPDESGWSRSRDRLRDALNDCEASDDQ